MLLAIAVAGGGYKFGYQNGIDAINKQDRDRAQDVQGELSKKIAALETSENRLQDAQTQLQQLQDSYNRLVVERNALLDQVNRLDPCAYIENELDSIERAMPQHILYDSADDLAAYKQRRDKIQAQLSTCSKR